MPFLQAARFREQLLGNIPYVNESSIPRLLRLRNAGYLERVKLAMRSTGTYTTAGPTGVDVFGQYCGPIERIILQANATGKLFDVSGFGAKIITWLDTQFRYGAGASQVTPNGAVLSSVGFPYIGPPDRFIAAPALVAFVNLWSYDIPVALQLANKAGPHGLYQLAIQANEVNLDIRHRPVATNTVGSPGAGVYTGNAANLTVGPGGETTVHQVFFDPIADPKDQPSGRYIHQWAEIQAPINADGTTEVKLAGTNYYTRIILVYVQGAAAALDLNGWVSPASQGVITSVKLAYGANLAPLDYRPAELAMLNTQRYNQGFIPGVYMIDLLEDTHTDRDLINAAATTELRILIETAGGTYSGGAYLKVITEQLQEIQVAPAGAGLAQGVAA